MGLCHLACGTNGCSRMCKRGWLRSAQDESFDVEEPRMFMVAPTADEEDALQEQPEPKPDLPSEIMEWEVRKAFDKGVQAWPTTWLNAFACDALYNLLKGDLPKSFELMCQWLKLSTAVDMKVILPPRSRAACEQVDTFATAYVAVAADSEILTAHRHAAFTSVFTPQKGKPQAEFFKLLATTCRKNLDFKTLEASLIRGAGKELEAGDDLRAILATIISGGLNQEHVEKTMTGLATWVPACRPGVTARITTGIKAWLAEQVAQLTSQDASAISDTAAALSTLSWCKEKLSFFALISEHAADAHEIQEKATTLLNVLNAKSSSAFFESLAQDGADQEPLESSGFVGKVDALLGHDTTELQPTLQIIGAALVGKLHAFAEGIAKEGAPETLRQVLANALAINDHTKLFSDKVMKAIVDKAIALRTTFVAYNTSQTKSNLNAFNKAVLQWKAFKLSTGEQSHAQVNMLRSCLIGNTTALEEHMKIQSQKSGDAVKELTLHIGEYKGISCGCRDGCSWKTGIEDDWSVDRILEHASVPRTGLLAGPGSKVSMAKDELTKAVRIYTVL